MKERVILLISLIASFAIASFAKLESARAAAPVSYTPSSAIDWTTYGTLPYSKTTGSFSVQAGDVLVVYLVAESYGTIQNQTFGVSSSPSQTWTLAKSIIVDNLTWVSVWTATASSSGSMTVTFSQTGGAGSIRFGGQAFVFRNSNGVGASASNTGSPAAPSVNLTTTAANSAIVVVSGDWNAGSGASRTWQTGAGAVTEANYTYISGYYTVYAAYYADVGAIGAKTVGLSAPSTQKFSAIAIEIKGGGSTPKVRHKVISD